MEEELRILETVGKIVVGFAATCYILNLLVCGGANLWIAALCCAWFHRHGQWLILFPGGIVLVYGGVLLLGGVGFLWEARDACREGGCRGLLQYLNQIAD